MTDGAIDHDIAFQKICGSSVDCATQIVYGTDKSVPYEYGCKKSSYRQGELNVTICQ